MQQMIFIADFIACSTCFGNHYAHHQELESIIQMVAAFGVLVFKLSVWCGAEGYVSGLQAAALLVKQQPANLQPAQHVSGNIMPIIRSSRVLYRWSLPLVFGALVFKLSVWCGAEGYVSGLQAAALLVKQQPAPWRIVRLQKLTAF